MPHKDPEVRKRFLNEWRQKNKERLAFQKREWAIKSTFGITVEEYDQWMSSDCSICGSESSHLDHCHETGRIRGPLCQKCNHGLGLFDDSPERLLSAAAYLQKEIA
jgi:hypothetical protein